MTELLLREALPAEAGVLAALHARGFDEPWSAESIAELMAMPGAFALLALVDESPAGFVLVRTGGGEAEIITICVLPEARVRGLGRALMQAAMQKAQAAGADAMFLEVADDNQPAILLYRACGFEQVGKRPGYYARGAGRVDALIWQAALVKEP